MDEIRPPTHINNKQDDGCLEIIWPDGLSARLAFHEVRASCCCAQCVHELTGERLLDPTTIPADIRAAQLQLVGAYALRIDWSDNHNTGLYTWEHLRKLCEGADSGPETH